MFAGLTLVLGGSRVAEGFTWGGGLGGNVNGGVCGAGAAMSLQSM